MNYADIEVQLLNGLAHELKANGDVITLKTTMNAVNVVSLSPFEAKNISVLRRLRVLGSYPLKELFTRPTDRPDTVVPYAFLDVPHHDHLAVKIGSNTLNGIGRLLTDNPSYALFRGSDLHPDEVSIHDSAIRHIE